MYMQTSPSTGQALIRSAERIAKLLSETLTNGTTEVIKTRPNLGNNKADTVRPHKLEFIIDLTVALRCFIIPG